jgi:hypothetical protein
VEPDADHDGFGDETQDQCPTDKTTQGPCPANTTKPPPAKNTTGSLTASLSGKRTFRLAKALKSGLAFKLTTNEAASAAASVTVAKSVAKKLGLGKRFIVAKAKLRVSKSGTATLSVRFGRRAKAALANATRGVSALVTLRVSDKAGNVVHLGKRVKLKA